MFLRTSSHAHVARSGVRKHTLLLPQNSVSQAGGGALLQKQLYCRLLTTNRSQPSSLKPFNQTPQCAAGATPCEQCDGKGDEMPRGPQCLQFCPVTNGRGNWADQLIIAQIPGTRASSFNRRVYTENEPTRVRLAWFPCSHPCTQQVADAEVHTTHARLTVEP